MFRLSLPPTSCCPLLWQFLFKNKSNRQQRKILFPLLPLSTIVSAFWNFLSVLIPVIWYWGVGSLSSWCPVWLFIPCAGTLGYQGLFPLCLTSLSVLLLLLLSRFSRVRLWTTLKENLGSACTHILSYTRHLPFLSAWKLHKGLCTETWVNWCPAPYWSGMIWGLLQNLYPNPALNGGAR